MDTFSGRLWGLAGFFILMMSMAEACAEGGLQRQYVPGVGELMGATQMRHAKLWLAGKAMNWPLAEYELGEIREGLDDAVLYHPVFKNSPLAELFGKYMSQPLAETARAIDGQHSSQFNIAFEHLTAACNACHQAAGFGFIVIKRPVAAQFSNQDFKAQGR